MISFLVNIFLEFFSGRCGRRQGVLWILWPWIHG